MLETQLSTKRTEWLQCTTYCKVLKENHNFSQTVNDIEYSDSSSNLRQKCQQDLWTYIPLNKI